MFINRVGAQFQCEGITYTIGGKVCANDASDYEGLYGTITEIRDGDDRETENDTPDIYCSFMPPVLADDIKAIESRFSQLYRREMHLEDIGLDTVIMAPDMLKVLEPIPSWQKLTIYIIREDWAFGGDYGEDFSLTTTPGMAKYILTELVTAQLESGYASEWPDRPDWGVECTPRSYEFGLHDSYYENHYKVCIEQQELPMSLPAKLQKRLQITRIYNVFTGRKERNVVYYCCQQEEETSWKQKNWMHSPVFRRSLYGRMPSTCVSCRAFACWTMTL